MRLLDGKKINYQVYSYAHSKETLDGLMEASLIGKPQTMVFKTLLTKANLCPYDSACWDAGFKESSGVWFVKRLEILGVKELLSLTAYVRGGCGPMGMPYQYPTYIDE